MASHRPPPPRRRKDIDERTRTAFHEAGHAVLSAAINDKPGHVSIRNAHGTLGRSGQKMFARPTSLAQVYLAGFAAEHIATGRRPRQYNIETGLGILAHTDSALVETIEGVDSCDGYGAVEQVLCTGVRVVEDDLRREVDRLYDVARESLSAVWSAVKSVAEALLVHEEIDRDGIDRAIGDINIYTPIFAIQRAHGLLRAVQVPPGPARGGGEVVDAAMRPARKRSNVERRQAAPERPEENERRVARLLTALRREAKLAPVVAAYERRAAESGQTFGKNGLKTKSGKLFALFTQGTLVVKLPKNRVAALVSEGVGKPFDPGHGRLMREWLTVTNPKASWAALAKEAFAFVVGSKR